MAEFFKFRGVVEGGKNLRLLLEAKKLAHVFHWEIDNYDPSEQSVDWGSKPARMRNKVETVREHPQFSEKVVTKKAVAKASILREGRNVTPGFSRKNRTRDWVWQRLRKGAEPWGVLWNGLQRKGMRSTGMLSVALKQLECTKDEEGRYHLGQRFKRKGH